MNTPSAISVLVDRRVPSGLVPVLQPGLFVACLAGLFSTIGLQSLHAVSELRADDAIELEGHPAGVAKAVWLPDSSQLLTADRSANLILWDVAKRKDVSRFSVGIGFVRALGVFDEGRKYFACVNSAVVIGMLPGGKQSVRVSELSGAMFNMSAAVSPDGSTLATLVSGHSVERFALKDGAHLGSLPLPSAAASLCYLPDGRLAVGGERVDNIWIFQGEEKLPSLLLPGLSGRCDDLLPSPNGTMLAALTSRAAAVVKVDPNAIAVRFQPNGGYLEAVGWSADGDQIATGGSKGILEFWDAKGGAAVRTLNLNGEGRSSLHCFQSGRAVDCCRGRSLHIDGRQPASEKEDR